MIEKLIGIFFPKICPLCQRTISSKEVICAKCKNKVLLVKEPKCVKCGKALKLEENICSDCKKTKHYFDKGISLFQYNKEMKQSIYQFKYDGMISYADFYGYYFAEEYNNYLIKNKVEVIIPVPLFKKKKIRRGFNQAEELAKAISKYTSIKADSSIIIRKKETIPQKGLSDNQRRRNLQGAFAVNVNKAKHYKVVLLVDDIYTTGSTMDACAKVLKAAGVEKVLIMSIATKNP